MPLLVGDNQHVEGGVLSLNSKKMEQVYTISKPIKISFCLGATAIICYSIYLISTGLKTGKTDDIIVPLLMMVAVLLITINQLKSRVVISDRSIVQSNLFFRKELEFKDIAGFRLYGKAILINPVKAGDPVLQLYNYNTSDGNETLMQWIEKNLKNLT